jgi:hypothetical protein
VDVNVDPQELAGLLEQSQDLQADAINGSKEPLSHLVEAHRAQEDVLDDGDEMANRHFADQHRRTIERKLATTGLLGAAGGGLLVALLASPAFASEPADVQILQTAASIETLAVSTYATALTLPYIGGSEANPVVKKFAQVTKSQHAQHKAAFNSAIIFLHGKKQNNPDPAFVPVVKKAVAGLAGASAAQGTLGVVGLALELENIAAETYVNDMGQLKNTNAKKITASIMGVEAQHASVLLAVQALLQGGAPQLITLSTTNVASLPAAAGSVGFPNAFYPTKDAAPMTQGAIK